MVSHIHLLHNYKVVGFPTYIFYTIKGCMVSHRHLQHKVVVVGFPTNISYKIIRW